MAETRRPLYRTLAAVPFAAALAGCAATHVGDDWQCPLAQGEVCTSIAAADPAVAPDAAPPALATRTPLYRAPGSEAAETESATGAMPRTKARPCAEGCNPFAWLGRLLGPRDASAETSENAEAVSTAPVKDTSAPVAVAAPDEMPCGAGQPAPEPDAAPANTDDEAEPIDGAGTPCPIAAEAQEPATPAPIAATEPIDPSATAAIPCGADNAPATPDGPSVPAEATSDAPVFEDTETSCAEPVSVEETPAAESTMIAKVDITSAESSVATPEDTLATSATDATPPTSDVFVPPPAPDALRSGEVVGRIWIAPFVDAGGVYREGAWVRAVLAPARWRR